jgi:BirA family biotin operon repressor/biotin-[acetyl-CoA-carboxylase] ligase
MARNGQALMIVGSRFYRLSEVDSTNDYIKGILKQAPEGTVVLADVQTAGKGSKGRNWYSPEGGLWMSILLDHCDNCLMPLTAAVAVSEAFQSYGIRLGIKWPNDLLLNRKKVAGILTEIVDDRAILGIGINLNVLDFPDHLAKKASSILVETKKHLDTQTVYQDVCHSLDQHYRSLKEDKIDDLLKKWRDYSVMIGRDIRIELPDRVVMGRVLDIDRQGGLIVLRADYGIEHIIAGDCSLLNWEDSAGK